jgi:hypothetical protein
LSSGRDPELPGPLRLHRVCSAHAALAPQKNGTVDARRQQVSFSVTCGHGTMRFDGAGDEMKLPQGASVEVMF